MYIPRNKKPNEYHRLKLLKRSVDVNIKNLIVKNAVNSSQNYNLIVILTE